MGIYHDIIEVRRTLCFEYEAQDDEAALTRRAMRTLELRADGYEIDGAVTRKNIEVPGVGTDELDDPGNHVFGGGTGWSRKV